MTPERSRHCLSLALAVLGIVTLALMGVVLRVFVFPPPPVTFERMRVTTPTVPRGGILEVQLQATYRNLTCFSGAIRLLRFANGVEVRAIGTRYAISAEQPQRQYVVHEIELPPDAPLGVATVQIRDVFTCGPSPVDSPVRTFQIVDG